MRLLDGTDESIIRQNIEMLVLGGHTMAEAERIAREYAAQAAEYAGNEGDAEELRNAPAVLEVQQGLAPDARDALAMVLDRILKKLEDGDSDDVISRNIAELIRSGHKRAEAIAIALEHAGKANPVTKALHVVGEGRVLVVKGAPTPAEMLRNEPFVGADARVLREALLVPIGKTRDTRAVEAETKRLLANYPVHKPEDFDRMATGIGAHNKTLTEAEHVKQLACARAARLRAGKKLAKDDGVMLAWCAEDAHEELEKFIVATKPDVVVSLTDEFDFEKDTGVWNLPSVEALAASGAQHSAEVARKVAAIRKRLDETAHRGAHSIQLVKKGALPTDETPIHKADARQKIVYGVVLDPYQVDAQDDWTPPREIEATAHAFVKSSRVIGLHHAGVAPDAALVESFVESYPTESDHARALANEPHRAYRRSYGSDKVHSGAWVIGVQLSDPLWRRYESGELGAFSIEGLGQREDTTEAEMPAVTFVDLEEVKR